MRELQDYYEHDGVLHAMHAWMTFASTRAMSVHDGLPAILGVEQEESLAPLKKGRVYH